MPGTIPDCSDRKMISKNSETIVKATKINQQL